MNLRQIIGELAACATFMLLMAMLLVFGNALRPYEPSMHSEITYQPTLAKE